MYFIFSRQFLAGAPAKIKIFYLRKNQWRWVHCNEIMISPLAFAARWPGKTRGAMVFSLNFLVTFSFKRKSDK
jgi:hypothetical protein